MIIQYENTSYNLATMHTKQLVQLLRRLNKGPYCECCYDPEWITAYYKTSHEIIPSIREELSKREHVPNKQEAKMIRKQKAVQQKNQSNRKYRNR